MNLKFKALRNAWPSAYKVSSAIDLSAVSNLNSEIKFHGKTKSDALQQSQNQTNLQNQRSSLISKDKLWVKQKKRFALEVKSLFTGNFQEFAPTIKKVEGKICRQSKNVP